MHTINTALLAVSLCVASVTAQSTWIVDANGGPGAQFTDLPPALAVAVAGDTVVVRAGAYSPGVTSRGIRIRCETGASASITVQDLVAAEAFVLRGLGGPLATFRAERCAGSVVVEGSQASFVFDRCARVSLNACDGGAVQALFVGFHGLEATASNLHVSGGSYLGYNSRYTAVVLRDSTAWLGAVQIEGSPGVTTYPSPGLELLGDSNAWVTGTGAEQITAGCKLSGFPPCVVRLSDVAIAGDKTATLTLDPRVTTGVIQGPVVRMRDLPSLGATGAPFGGAATATLHPTAAGNAALLASVPSAALDTPWGPLWLPLRHVLIQAAAVTTTPWTTTIPVDASFYPASRSVTLQAVQLVGNTLALSNPATIALL